MGRWGTALVAKPPTGRVLKRLDETGALTRPPFVEAFFVDAAISRRREWLKDEQC